jgi:replication factor C small subunit
MVENNLWVEKFRPDTLAEYIGNDRLKVKVQEWLDAGEVPHLLFYSLSGGTGKTTLARIIAKGLDCDMLSINASDDNSVETIRNKVKDFAQTASFAKWKIVFLDEADYLTPNAQAVLRNVMETYSATTRFILTCNYVDKLIPQIRSRCRDRGFEIYPPSIKEVAVRIIEILKSENIEIDNNILKKVLRDGYPDVRSILDTLQGCIENGKLCKEPIGNVSTEYINKVIGELKSNNDAMDKMTSIRQIFADSGVKDYTKLYSELFNRVSEYSSGKVGKLILTLAASQESYSLVADKELHVTALIIQIISQTSK